MAHFANVVDGIVTNVIVAEQEFVDNLEGTWIQTSYNTRRGKHLDPVTQEEDSGTPLRKNYAGVGYSYDSVRDAFIPPKPFPSWILNEDTCVWDAPVAKPAEGKHNWNEDTKSWDAIED